MASKGATDAEVVVRCSVAGITAPPSTRLLVGGLVLVALNLRPAIASIPPLIDTIRTELALSAAVAGLLTTLPVVCMGIFAPLSARLGRRVGRERAIQAALILLTVGTALRLVGDAVVPLFAATLLAGIGVAVAMTLLPGFVKEHFPRRAGLFTGLYTMGLCAGAMLAAGATVPLSRLLEGWPPALAAWALLGVAAAVVWFPLARRGPADPRPGFAADRHSMPWRSGLAWLISLFLGLQSLLFYSTLTWLPPLYVDLSWSAADAGLLLSVFNLAQLVAALVIPALADRFGPDRRPWIGLAVAVSFAGLLAVTLAPLAAPSLWAVLLGTGQGGAFALALVLLVDYATDAPTSARLSAMAFLVGYLLAALGPFAVGGLHDLTGGFTAPFLGLTVVALAELVLGASAFNPHRSPLHSRPTPMPSRLA